MKKLVLIIAAVFLGSFTTTAATVEDKVATVNYRYGNSFIFVENGVTFSVYPDGEFDFYIDNRVNVGVGARVGNVGITFNSGYNYNPFVQYDDYGAVIQVENVPIYYDYYGRVSQIGGVDVWYRNGRVRRLGGLNVFYNGGVFSHYTGFINIYNRGYVYRPWHRWFARPAIGFCNVWTTPYRRWYNPVRYTWYRPYRYNHRRAYAQIGREFRYNKQRRARVYRNDNRVSIRENRGRRSSDFARRNDGITQRRSVTRSNNTVAQRGNRNSVGRSNTARQGEVRRSTTTRRTSDVGRSNRGISVTQRSVTRSPRSTTVTKREVKRTPNNRTVTKRSTTYTSPKRSVAQNRSRSTSVKRSAPAKRTVTRSTTTKRSTGATKRSSRSNSTRSTRR